MKKLALSLLGFSSLLILASCSSDDDGGSSGPIAPVVPEITGTLNTEEGKQELENNSINLLNKVEEFKGDNALAEIIELAEFLTSNNSGSSKELNSFELTAINSVTNVAAFKSTNLVTAVSVQNQTIEDNETLASQFEEITGIYTYNPANDEFEKTADSKDAIYNIAYNGKNAVFSFTEFNSTKAKNNTEVPTRSVSNLKINGTTVFSQDYTASIEEGSTKPNNFNSTLNIGEFNFTTSFINDNNTKAIQSFDFKIGDTVILGYNFITNGNFNELEKEDTSIEKVVNNASLSLQFLNATLFTSAKNDNFTPKSELTVDEEVALLNSNINSELSIDGKSIAKMEFYKDQDKYEKPVFTPSTPTSEGVFESVTVTEDIVNARFKFADGTSSDFDTYVDNSFNDTESKFETVLDAFEDLFKNVNLGSEDEDEIVIENTPEVPTTGI